jgi:hypothetical protein
MERLRSGDYKGMGRAIDREAAAIEEFRRATEQIRTATTLPSSRKRS